MEKLRERQKISYCGLYCPDCLPAQREFFSKLRDFKKTLEDYNVRQYIKDCKEGVNPDFDGYEKFFDILDALLKEECTVWCHDGPYSEANCTPACPIRVCCKEKGIEGCWRCDGYESCPRITDMIKRHPDMMYSLKTLKERGIEGFRDFRGKHHTWQKRRCPQNDCMSDGKFCLHDGDCVKP